MNIGCVWPVTCTDMKGLELKYLSVRVIIIIIQLTEGVFSRINFFDKNSFVQLFEKNNNNYDVKVEGKNNVWAPHV